MNEIARRWRVLVAGAAAGTAGILGIAGTTASAQPAYPQPPLPAPATVTQTVVVTPNAAPQVVGQPGVTPATIASPANAATPGLVAAPIPAPPPVTIAPASSGTLFDYFKEKAVQLEPQASRDFKALNIVLPMPRGWAQVPDPNVPDAFAVIADRSSPDLYTPNAQVIVYKLIGDFDPKDAISHGFIDSQQLPAFRAIDASLADFGGMPSSFIEGTYRENALTLNTSRRNVIATTGPDRYLVSLSVTSSAGNQGVSTAAEATDAVLRGFRVSVPAPTAPLAPTAPPAQPGPAAPPQLLGLPG
jgi:Probable lipoprotein LpqN